MQRNDLKKEGPEESIFENKRQDESEGEREREEERTQQIKT